MLNTRKRPAALLLAFLLCLTLLPLPARADTVTVGGQTYQDGLGSGADLAGAKAALTRTVKSWSPSVDLTPYGLGTAQLAQVFDQVFLENPSLFYLENGYAYTSHTLRKAPGTMVIGLVRPSYYGQFSAKDIPVYEAAVQQALTVLRPGMSDFDKALALHDYLAGSCQYDDTLTHYSPYHALIDHTAVCQGYLLAYSDLLNRAGVTNYPAISASQNHGWNAVRLGGAWYHVDVTWDHTNGLPPDWVFHTNFLLSDQGIQRSGTLHRNWVTAGACTDTRYETSFLPTLRAAVLYPPEGDAYFLLNGQLCRSRDLSALQYQVVSAAGRGAGLDLRTGAYYSPADARLLYWDGSIYYTDAVNVYRYDLADGTTSRHGPYTGGKGYLYSLTVTGTGPENALLSAQVRTVPNGPVQDTYTLRPTLSAASAHLLVCPARPFQDVSPGQWYHEAVDNALTQGWMQGVSPSQFDPNGTTTRAMIVTILHRMEGSPQPGPAVFSDVAAGTWYADPVNWAAANGIVNGLSEDAFGPDQTITRQQLAAILCRYARYKGLDTAADADMTRYADAPRIAPYAAEALSWANAAGLITGRTADTLAPDGTATRAEAATIFTRLSGLLPPA